MTTQSRIVATLLTLGLVAGGAAYGADTGAYYIGGSMGQARPNFDTASSVANAGQSVNTSDTAWKVYTGYQFHRYFSVEFTYINLGSYNVSNGNTIEPDGWGVGLVGTWPIANKVSLIGRIGEYRMRQQMYPSGTADNTWSGSIGGGLKYDFSPNVYGRAEYERIQSMGSNQNTIENNSNVYTLGLGYKF